MAYYVGGAAFPICQEDLETFDQAAGRLRGGEHDITRIPPSIMRVQTPALNGGRAIWRQKDSTQGNDSRRPLYRRRHSGAVRLDHHHSRS